MEDGGGVGLWLWGLGLRGVLEGCERKMDGTRRSSVCYSSRTKFAKSLMIIYL